MCYYRFVFFLINLLSCSLTVLSLIQCATFPSSSIASLPFPRYFFYSFKWILRSHRWSSQCLLYIAWVPFSNSLHSSIVIHSCCITSSTSLSVVHYYTYIYMFVIYKEFFRFFSYNLAQTSPIPARFLQYSNSPS